MTKTNTITRRGLLSGLAAMPLAVGSTIAADGGELSPDEAFRQALADFKQAVRDRYPDQRMSFSTAWDEDGDTFLFRGIMAVQVYPVAL